jgi:hypothetical protein
MLKKLSIAVILLCCLMQFAGCISTGNNFPVDPKAELIPLAENTPLTNHVKGWFLSDAMYKWQFDRCK